MLVSSQGWGFAQNSDPDLSRGSRPSISFFRYLTETSKIQTIQKIMNHFAPAREPCNELTSLGHRVATPALIPSHCTAISGLIPSHCVAISGLIPSHCVAVSGLILSHCVAISGLFPSPPVAISGLTIPFNSRGIRGNLPPYSAAGWP